MTDTPPTAPLSPNAPPGVAGIACSDLFACELGMTLELPPITRLLVWFSAGGTSAVAAKLAVNEKRGQLPIRVLYCETRSHHEDNMRFVREVESWINHPIEIVRNHKYRDVDDVIVKERYLNGPDGAKCTQQLKIRVRKEIQNAANDLQVFGFHYDEQDRALEYAHNWREVRLWLPLIERKLRHEDCLALLREVGIELPKLYRQGYRNNNCLGCVKGGMGYWNKMRVDYPDVFATRAKQERMIGHSCIKGVFLDELDPTAGRYDAEPDIACEGVCAGARRELEACESGEANHANGGTQRGRDDDAPPATETQSRPSLK